MKVFKKTRGFLILLQVFLFFFCPVHGSEIHIPDIWSNNMVIQSGDPFLMSGFAIPFEAVSVQIENEIRWDTADKNGNWTVRFPAFRTGDSFDILIRAREEKKIIKNVIVGEVWLCSGQSNMEMTAGRTDVKEALNNSGIGQIRYFVAQNTASLTLLNNMKGYWVVCTPENAARCSAVGLSFAWHLSQALGRTVGLIVNAKGGTPIESWTELDVLERKDYNDHIFREREQWKRDRIKYEEQYNLKLSNWEKASQEAKQQGRAAPDKIFPPFQLRENWNPGSLYNSLIYPIRDFAFKGVIWYQGESNSNYPFIYRYQLVDMIKSWRDLFKNQKLPFYIIQLPEYTSPDNWTIMRESQASVTELDAVWLVVSLGLGDSSTIHPLHKMELGRRLALRVLANEYQYILVSSGPVFRSMRREGKEMILDFECFHSIIESSDGQPIRNMEVSGSDLKFLPAKVKIKDNELIVWSDKIKHPASVRYAWSNAPPDINFANRENIPAAPFWAGEGNKHLLSEYRAAYAIRDKYDFFSRKQMKEYATGFFRIHKSSKGYIFSRYPKKVYKILSPSKIWDIRAHCTSGITLSFITSSEKIFLSGTVILNSPQTRPFHVLCNGKMIDSLPRTGQVSGNFYRVVDLPFGKEEKTVEIIFPAYSKGILRKVGIQKGATLKDKLFKGRILALGNSITQMGGEYDGFLTLAADELGYSLQDAGIGGHIFQSAYLTRRFEKRPDIILVEYGTNDWSGSKDAANARPFLEKLTTLYPAVTIALIEPLYRFRPVGTDSIMPVLNKKNQSLEEYRRELKKIALEFRQVVILDHRELLPGNPGLYSDGVHPNREGQKVLGERLAKRLKKLEAKEIVK